MAKILVVDDSPSESEKFREILARHGYEVLQASNGEQGIEMTKRELPALILMDVVMPVMNGFQATRMLSRDAATGHIPIIIVSTKDQPTDRIWGKRQGAADYLTKPIDEAVLIALVKRLLL